VSFSIGSILPKEDKITDHSLFEEEIYSSNYSFKNSGVKSLHWITIISLKLSYPLKIFFRLDDEIYAKQKN